MLFDLISCLLYFIYVSREVLDYDLIIKKCGVNELASQFVIEKISNLKNEFDADDLTSIYNYFLLNIKEPEILTYVIRCSDEYKSKTTLVILLNLLQSEFDNKEDSIINLKVICTKAIANYKDSSTVGVFLDCLNNKKEHYKVRLACADALGRIGDKYAVRPLLNVIEDEEEKSVYLKESATFALGLLGDTSAIDPLISILESKPGFLNKFTFLKEKIIEALGKLNFNNQKIMKALKKSLLDSSPIVRINAIEAIMNSEDDESVVLIKPLLQDDDDEVKKNALIALYNLLGRDILDEVIELPIYAEFLKNEAQSLIDEYEEDDE